MSALLDRTKDTCRLCLTSASSTSSSSSRKSRTLARCARFWWKLVVGAIEEKAEAESCKYAVNNSEGGFRPNPCKGISRIPSTTKVWNGWPPPTSTRVWNGCWLHCRPLGSDHCRPYHLESLIYGFNLKTIINLVWGVTISDLTSLCGFAKKRKVICVMAGHGISSTHLGVYRGSDLKFAMLQGKPIDVKPTRKHVRPSRMMSYTRKKQTHNSSNVFHSAMWTYSHENKTETFETRAQWRGTCETSSQMDRGAWNEFAHLVMWTYQHKTKEKRYQPQPHGALHTKRYPIHQTLLMDPRDWNQISQLVMWTCCNIKHNETPPYSVPQFHIRRTAQIALTIPSAALDMYTYNHINNYNMLKQANQGLRSCDPNWGAENADLTLRKAFQTLS